MLKMNFKKFKLLDKQNCFDLIWRGNWQFGQYNSQTNPWLT